MGRCLSEAFRCDLVRVTRPAVGRPPGPGVQGRANVFQPLVLAHVVKCSIWSVLSFISWAIIMLVPSEISGKTVSLNVLEQLGLTVVMFIGLVVCLGRLVGPCLFLLLLSSWCEGFLCR